MQLVYSAFVPVVGFPAFGYPLGFVEQLESQGQDLLDDAARLISVEQPGVEVTTVFSRFEPRRRWCRPATVWR